MASRLENDGGGIMDAGEQNRFKKEAAKAAAQLVKNGMIVGLGTGSTAAYLVTELGRRVAEEGLRFTGVPTSERTAEQARSLGIPLATLADIKEIDVTIDGADEVQLGTLSLIKGHGGALLREKIVAAASKRLAVIVDETKLVKRLGGTLAVPVEVVPFGWEATERKLRAIGAGTELRPGLDDKPYVTDGGHYILDCEFGLIADPKKVARQLDETVGVVEHGLFLGLAKQVFVGGPGGVKILKLGTNRGKPSARAKKKSKRAHRRSRK
ncbi:MAG: ribose-5-phosphate isomerase RpiA [Candidatus Acidiferrales bacterium]